MSVVTEYIEAMAEYYRKEDEVQKQTLLETAAKTSCEESKLPALLVERGAIWERVHELGKQLPRSMSMGEKISRLHKILHRYDNTMSELSTEARLQNTIESLIELLLDETARSLQTKNREGI